MKNIEKLKNYKTVWACDFCKREFSSKKQSDHHEIKCYQNPKNQKFPFNNKIKRAWFWLWIITMVVFGVTIPISANLISKSGVVLLSKTSLSYLFFGNICLGIIAFLAWLIPWKKPKNNQISFFTRNIFIFCLAYLVINPIIFALESSKAQNLPGYKEKNFKSMNPTVTPTPIKPTVTPTPTKQTKKTTSGSTNNTKTNTIDCVGPDGVHFQTTQKECDEFNQAWGNTNHSNLSSSTTSDILIDNDHLLSLINQYRQQNGLQTLSKSSELCGLAEKRAAYLVADRMSAYLSSQAGNHTGFESMTNNYSGNALGENIGANLPPGFKANPNSNYSGYLKQFTTNQDAGAISQWIHSPPHNALMLVNERDGFKMTNACVAHRIVEDYAILTVLLVGDK